MEEAVYFDRLFDCADTVGGWVICAVDMAVITLTAYWKGRNVLNADELTDEITANAQVTVEKANELLARAGRSDINTVNSGWRPRAVNDATANAASGSKHLTAQAVDLPDADRTLATWCVDNLDVLAELGLHMEDPRWTPTWVHVQTVPPKSGKRVYIPSSAPPKDPSFPVTWVI